MANYFDSALKAEGILGTPLEALARSVFEQESQSGKNKNAFKKNAHGVYGPMQVKDTTFKEVADEGWDLTNNEHNSRAGIRYLKKMFDLAGGDLSLAAAGYYGGPVGLAKAKKGIGVGDRLNSKAPTTLQYAQQVLARLGPQTQAETQVAQAPVRAPMQEGGAPIDTGALTVAAYEPLVLDPVNVPTQMGTLAEWEALRQQVPETNPVVSLASYGGMNVPQFSLPEIRPQAINFNMFRPMRGRA